VPMSPLLVNASEILRVPGTHRTLAASVSLADVDVADDRVAGDVTLDLAIVSSLDDLAVAGTLTVAWSDQCRRCLRPLAGDLVIDVAERYAPAESETLGDTDAFPIEHGQLDLRPLVREGVLLGIPDAPVCRDDCPGLCPLCGADLTAGPCTCDLLVRDERWAVLDQLRGDEAG
jgi:uncharacterized protein